MARGKRKGGAPKSFLEALNKQMTKPENPIGIQDVVDAYTPISKSEAEIRSQVAREILTEIETTYENDDLHCCGDALCPEDLFTKKCFWWQSLKRKYGIEGE